MYWVIEWMQRGAMIGFWVVGFLLIITMCAPFLLFLLSIVGRLLLWTRPDDEEEDDEENGWIQDYEGCEDCDECDEENEDDDDGKDDAGKEA